MISSLNPEQTRITNCTNLRYLDKRHRKPLVNITDRERERERNGGRFPGSICPEEMNRLHKSGQRHGAPGNHVITGTAERMRPRASI